LGPEISWRKICGFCEGPSVAFKPQGSEGPWSGFDCPADVGPTDARESAFETTWLDFFSILMGQQAADASNSRWVNTYRPSAEQSATGPQAAMNLIVDADCLVAEDVFSGK